ncbi:hypothetical protein DSO57_1020200 [Entomophthora muscae]|uniref:Uncharacterized protein n=3 Tax=Entomophthora muscae TaxID=34485 RepID=A0ACC2RDG7_9FUNG|nr:hypothetical protein DSO57_1038678 [Entomophthora muscae]KAJ9056734.1 hypothetical protein DSO57_1029911 [Entomophthora muscae]KAJ9061485.1 hypothetical protein DSO57_1020200 [Entomophthora muscae]
MSRVHTPLYASQPTGRRSITKHRVVESVLPEELVAQIRTTQFDEMLSNGFSTVAFSNSSKNTSKPGYLHTLRLTLTPSNARDTFFLSKRLSRFC